MDEQRISVDTRVVRIELSNGQQLEGEMFLQLHGLHQSGPQRVGEVLGSEDAFLPLRVAGQVKLINLDQVVAVAVAAELEFDPLLELGERHEVQVTAAGGEPLEAEIFVNLPNGRNRSKDFLDQKKRFLLFRCGDEVVYLARRHILLVED